MKRYDGSRSSLSHYNKVTGEEIGTPHIHDPQCPGGVRIPEPWEIPK